MFVSKKSMLGGLSFKELKNKWKAEGEIPEWYTTNSLQFFMNKYSFNGESVRSRDAAIAKYLAEQAPTVYPDWWETNPYTKGKTYEQVFFDLIFTDGYIVLSTPLKANGGLPDRGFTVSCSEQKLGNNVASKYLSNAELAIFTKFAHGTSIDLSSWLPEGAPIGEGDVSEGIIPIVDLYQNTTNSVTQGVRRGSIAFYLDVLHGDFDRLADKLNVEFDDLNVGWLVTDKLISLLNSGDSDAVRRMKKIMGIRIARGKGYFTKIDTMNRSKADTFKILDLPIYASNLCNELNLPTNSDTYSATCVILNVNLALYDQLPDCIFKLAHLMQDCNVSGYIAQIEATKPHNRQLLQKALNFTKDFRAVGTGVCGLHSLFMQKRIVYGSLESFYLNGTIFKQMQKETNEMNVWLADVLGVPDGVKRAGLHLRNATTMMMPPTKSSTELARNTPTEGIGLETALIKVKESAGGEIFRINYEFLNLMKERGKYTDDEVAKIAKAKGSLQNVDWLTEHEKAVFRIAFEIPMDKHIELCSQRQKYIDQQQSINLYFSGSDTESYIGEIHKQALLDEGINSLYYCYSSRGGRYVRPTECENCQ